MIIGIPKETQNFESRVAITPEIVKKLAKSDHSIIIEKDAGLNSNLSNNAYENSGAKIEPSSENILSKADIIFKVNAFSQEELSSLKEQTTAISFFQIKDEIEKVQSYIDKKISLFSMSHIPRTTLAQNMDALSSQSNIAGYKSIIIGADHITKYMPLLMTAAGTIKPAKVLILGAGVAGLSAIATAKRMGAQVYAFDVRPVVKEQVESLGANFIEVESESDEGTGEGGYAKEVSDDYKKKQGELIKDTIKNMDLIVSTALIPEKPAPVLIDQEMVNSMQPGSAIMDLAAINGGNCELTKCDEVINHNNVIIDGRSYLPSTMAQDASQLYAKNLFNLFTHLYKTDNTLDLNDEITNGSMLLNKGQINNELLQKFLNKES
tara:strand:- start:1897 stop:3033 length:1137 start_codon:yes stop_codon:yes gene_type:complete